MENKIFSEIGLQVPEGWRPYRFLLEGRMLRIFLEREKSEWKIHEIEYSPHGGPQS